MRWGIFFLGWMAFQSGAYAAIVAQPIEYQHDGQVLEGYLAYDNAVQGKRPGVIVVHEWKGLNDYARGRAEQLAALGYIAFAVDMYGKGIYAEDHQQAAKLSGAYREDRTLMRARARVGYEVLANHPLTDPGRMAAIGYCFGGTTVLEMARAGFDLKGVISFHGGLGTPMPAEPGTLKAKIVVMQGAEDTHTAGDIPDFKNEMRAAGADWQLIEFGGAVHSFTVPEAGNDPSKGSAYDPAADRRSWAMLEQFLKEIFA